jgi:hypothetical protein
MAVVLSLTAWGAVGASVANSDGTVQSTTTLELEAADDSDSDSGTVSFTFTTEDNATSADVGDTFHSESGGDVSFEFNGWEKTDGFSSGSQSSFTVDDNSQYRITYNVEAQSGASEGQYSFIPDVSVGYEGQADDVVGQPLTVDVDILEPSLGSISGQNVDATFNPQSGGEISETVNFDIDNNGDGYMDVSGISVSGVPAGISTDIDSEPDTVDAQSSESVSLDVTVDDSISEGDYSFQVSVDHTEGPEETFSVSVEVIKPPAAGVEQNSVNLGDILVGESRSEEITLTERGGYDSISGLETRTRGRNPALLSFPGLESLSISEDGEATQELVVDVENTANQGALLQWQTDFVPKDQDGLETDNSMTITAEVIYPPYYQEVSLQDASFVFNQPREQIDMFEEDVSIDIENGGDLEMEIQDIDPTIQGTSEVEVSVAQAPDSIRPRSSGDIVLDIDATPDTPEGNFDISVDVAANEPTRVPGFETGEVTVSSNISVEHKTRLNVDNTAIDFGEIVVTQQKTETTTLREQLGYQPVENFSLEQVSGPDRGWLQIGERPDNLEPGAAKPFTTSIAFDTSAELYRTYTWEFKASGDNVDDEIITIQATPKPVDFGETVSELETRAEQLDGESGSVAEETADALVTLEEMLQEGGDAKRSDITVMVSVGRSAILFVDALENAEEDIDAGEREAAQGDLVRASAAFNTLVLGAEQLESETLQPRLNVIQENAEASLDEHIEQQEEFYLEQLEDSETTVLEEAQTKRALSRLAELADNNERADELRQEASEAFETYSELVSSGNENFIAAQNQDEKIKDELFISVAGQHLFPISSLSAYNTQSEEVLAKYDRAAEQFERAGATERAAVVANEREAVASTYRTAYRISVGLGFITGLVLLVLFIWEIRALYRYRVDSEDAVTGDFLLPWSDMES